MAENKVETRNASSGTGVTEIHAHEGYRRYNLIDLNNTVIERTARELVEGSKLLSNQEYWVENFKATIKKVREWCDGFSDRLSIALVDIRSDKVLFYFVPRSDRYDLALGDEMTDLEVSLGGSSGIGHVETLQVPERSLDRFVGEKALLVWEKSPAAAA